MFKSLLNALSSKVFGSGQSESSSPGEDHENSSSNAHAVKESSADPSAIPPTDPPVQKTENLKEASTDITVSKTDGKDKNNSGSEVKNEKLSSSVIYTKGKNSTSDQDTSHIAAERKDQVKEKVIGTGTDQNTSSHKAAENGQDMSEWVTLEMPKGKRSPRNRKSKSPRNQGKKSSAKTDLSDTSGDPKSSSNLDDVIKEKASTPDSKFEKKGKCDTGSESAGDARESVVKGSLDEDSFSNMLVSSMLEEIVGQMSEVTVKDTMSDTVTVKDTMSDKVTVKDTMSDTVTVKDTMSDKITVEDTMSDTVTVKDTMSDKITVKDTMSDTVTVKDTMSDTVTVKDTMSDKITVKDTMSDKITVKDTMTDTKAENTNQNNINDPADSSKPQDDNWRAKKTTDTRRDDSCRARGASDKPQEGSWRAKGPNRQREEYGREKPQRGKKGTRRQDHKQGYNDDHPPSGEGKGDEGMSEERKNLSPIDSNLEKEDFLEYCKMSTERDKLIRAKKLIYKLGYLKDVQQDEIKDVILGQYKIAARRSVHGWIEDCRYFSEVMISQDWIDDNILYLNPRLNKKSTNKRTKNRYMEKEDSFARKTGGLCQDVRLLTNPNLTVVRVNMKSSGGVEKINGDSESTSDAKSVDSNGGKPGEVDPKTKVHNGKKEGGPVSEVKEVSKEKFTTDSRKEDEDIFEDCLEEYVENTSIEEDKNRLESVKTSDVGSSSRAVMVGEEPVREEGKREEPLKEEEKVEERMKEEEKGEKSVKQEGNGMGEGEREEPMKEEEKKEEPVKEEGNGMEEGEREEPMKEEEKTEESVKQEGNGMEEGEREEPMNEEGEREEPMKEEEKKEEPVKEEGNGMEEGEREEPMNEEGEREEPMKEEGKKEEHVKEEGEPVEQGEVANVVTLMEECMISQEEQDKKMDKDVQKDISLTENCDYNESEKQSQEMIAANDSFTDPAIIMMIKSSDKSDVMPDQLSYDTEMSVYDQKCDVLSGLFRIEEDPRNLIETIMRSDSPTEPSVTHDHTQSVMMSSGDPHTMVMENDSQLIDYLLNVAEEPKNPVLFPELPCNVEHSSDSLAELEGIEDFITDMVTNKICDIDVVTDIDTAGIGDGGFGEEVVNLDLVQDESVMKLIEQCQTEDLTDGETCDGAGEAPALEEPVLEEDDSKESIQHCSNPAESEMVYNLLQDLPILHQEVDEKSGKDCINLSTNPDNQEATENLAGGDHDHEYKQAVVKQDIQDPKVTVFCQDMDVQLQVELVESRTEEEPYSPTQGCIESYTPVKSVPDPFIPNLTEPVSPSPDK
ncbi:uncharacterized protein LOC117328334 [Pecten maximus]|uniref:uncharacterized protein LOC117328334 n=1 Tax=Pecten maximus TaxID=6579 RepID=UPI00145890BF|nr:uncharacterized protein LOC117328334 [Pecten maximus]